MSERPTVTQMLIAMAHVAATRSTCSRRQVGAVLARDGRVLSTGYNGAPSRLLHCVHVADEPCIESVHAEANALLFAARHGVASGGASLYLTDSPCYACAGLIINAGVVEVVFDREFRTTEGIARLSSAGLAVAAMRKTVTVASQWRACRHCGEAPAEPGLGEALCVSCNQLSGRMPGTPRDGSD